MAKQSLSAIIREILFRDIELASDTVFNKLRAKGITGDRRQIFKRIHHVRTELRKNVGSSAAPHAATPDEEQAAPAPVQTVSAPAPAQTTPTVVHAAPDLGHVLANVTRVNEVVTACGSSDTVRQVADAVRSCGGVDQFLKHLELVSDIRSLRATE
ncbi:MAG: hypothetical protein LC104_20435 [Bacteroidales bacterium]|nr:hypothetical protein [Bacteroidales bacterium]